MSQQARGLLLVHAATLLFGFPGLFAEWLKPLLPIQIVAGRTLFAAIFLILGLGLLGRLSLPQGKKTWIKLLATGVVLAFHWMAFFKAIQLTNVAIGLLAFSTFPLFTSLLEPLIFKEKLRQMDLFLALLVLVGISIVGNDALRADFGIAGILWGLAGSASFALMALLNRGLNLELKGLEIAAYQNLFAFIALLPFNIGLPLPSDGMTWGLLLLLGVLFTGIAHGMFNQSLAFIRASTASLIVSMEPLYGIILAFFLLDQKPGMLTLMGGGLILMAGVIPTLTIARQTKYSS